MLINQSDLKAYALGYYRARVSSSKQIFIPFCPVEEASKARYFRDGWAAGKRDASSDLPVVLTEFSGFELEKIINA
jgi:hypothetical protein